MSLFKKLSASLALIAVSLLVGCEPPAVEPELNMTAAPRTLDGAAQKSVITLTATDTKGAAGTGTVRLTSTAGSLKDGVELTFAAGSATGEFTCNRAMDAACSGPVKLTAEWVVGGKLVSVTTSITVTPPVVVVPDSGVALTASRTQLGIGLGNTADLVAVYAVDGVATPNAALSFTTTAGVLIQPDGGPFSSPATTDARGEVRAVLAESGQPGVARVSAIGPAGRGASATINIYTPDAGIRIATDRQTLTLGFGEVARLTVDHQLENRAVAGRPLTIETTAGRLLELDGGPFVSPSATDTAGRVVALLTDTGSPGTAVITAQDLSANVQASVSVALAPPDAGVVIATGRPNLYLGINDVVPVKATLYANGNPSPNRALNIVSNPAGLAVLSYPDAGVFNGTATTNGIGEVDLIMRDTGTPGTAVITATDPASNRTGTATVNLRTISTVTFSQMTCNGMPCTVLGINNSNFRTTGKLRFIVRDNQTVPQPVAGVSVTFSINLSSATGTTLAPAQAVTDVNGIAETTVLTGNAVGSFTVTATVLPGVAATSPSFGVRGAKATNRGFTIQCSRTTMSAYTAPLPPLDITANCTVTVVDRNNNPVGLATDISLRSEAGTIAPTVSTPEFSAATSASEGKATVDFRTVGDFPASDVQALTANPTQFPYARAAEPFRNDGLIVRNPRDGLVVIIAWTRGEEWFSDLDGNGVQNGNEPFVDQGEPFVDSNDNDLFDGTDTSFNVDGDGVYTPANGRWDADTFVWTKTYVLYTDRPLPSIVTFAPSTFNVAKAGQQVINVFMPDLNLNRAEAGTTIDFIRTATKGTVTANLPGFGLDGFGFDFDPRILTNVAGTAACPTATDRICTFQTRFGQWGQGSLGTLTVVGAPVIDMTAAQTDTITVRATTRGGTVLAPITGTIQ